MIDLRIAKAKIVHYGKVDTSITKLKVGKTNVVVENCIDIVNMIIISPDQERSL